MFDIFVGLCDYIGVWGLRSVAQPGRAQPSGGWGRRFESSHSDQLDKESGENEDILGI